VRWDELFRDLEGQLEAAGSAELAAEVADRSRREVAALRLLDRLRPAVGHPVRLHVQGAGQVTGTLQEVGAQWLLVVEPGGRQALVPFAALLGVAGIGARSTAPGQGGEVFARLGLAHALRGIARDRAPVTVWLSDGTALPGTVDRVGEDFVELAEHAPGEPRRRAEVSGVRAVPFAAIAAVRSG
jgi:hypothetical protein